MADASGNNIRFLVTNTTNHTFEVVGLTPLFGEFTIKTGHEFKGPAPEKEFFLKGSQAMGTFVCCVQDQRDQTFGVSACNMQGFDKQRGDFSTVKGVLLSLQYTGTGAYPTCRVTLENS
jgi:hypothetical protein